MNIAKNLCLCFHCKPGQADKHNYGKISIIVLMWLIRVKRMLHSRDRLSRIQAKRLRDLILSDGYVRKSGRKLVRDALANGRLEDSACEIFADLLLVSRPCFKAALSKVCSADLLPQRF
jgi:hypothetical protein